MRFLGRERKGFSGKNCGTKRKAEGVGGGGVQLWIFFWEKEKQKGWRARASDWGLCEQGSGCRSLEEKGVEGEINRDQLKTRVGKERRKSPMFDNSVYWSQR